MQSVDMNEDEKKLFIDRNIYDLDIYKMLKAFKKDKSNYEYYKFLSEVLDEIDRRQQERDTDDYN